MRASTRAILIVAAVGVAVFRLAWLAERTLELGKKVNAIRTEEGGRSFVATRIVSQTFSSGSTDFSATTNGGLTTYTWLTTNTVVTMANGRLKTNRYAAPNTLVWRPPMQDVSTNNGVVLTRTDIAFSSDPASDYDSVHDGEKTQATFSGGMGSTVKDAIVITSTNEETNIRAAYIWSHDHYPGSHLQYEGSDFDDSDRQYLEIKIVTAGGKPRTVFFDITSCF